MRQSAFPSLVLAGCALALCGAAAAQAGFGYKESPRDAPLEQVASSRSVQVLPNEKNWQSSGVVVRAGDTYLVTATGRWKLGGLCPETGPDGAGLYTLACWNLGGQLVPGASHATLIAKVGHDGTPFSVGDHHEFYATRDGVLYFMVNDHPDWFWDNTGYVTADVELVQSAAPPPVPVRRGGGGGGRPPR